jgi:hypothetical protein
MPSFFNAINISTATSGYSYVGLSPYVPAKANAVFLTLDNPNGYSYGILATGDADTNSYRLTGNDGGILRNGCIATEVVGIGADKTISVYADTTNMGLGIYGYFTSDELATPISGTPSIATPGIANAWATVDLSAAIPAYTTKQVYGVVMMANNNAYYGGPMGVRPTGSTLNAYASSNQTYDGCFAVQFTQGNGYKVDLYSNAANSPFYIVGFLIQNILTSYMAPKIVTPTVAGVYQTISTLPANATAATYTTYGGGVWQGYGFQPLSAPTIGLQGNMSGGFGFAGIPVGANQQIQAMMANITATTVYETGYWHPPSQQGLFFGTNF